MPTGEGKRNWRPLKDIIGINPIVQSKFLVVLNLYTILLSIPGSHASFTVLDLKDAFFSIPLAEEPWNLFAFKRTDPDTEKKAYLRWTVLPQRFVDLPNQFGQCL